MQAQRAHNDFFLHQNADENVKRRFKSFVDESIKKRQTITVSLDKLTGRGRIILFRQIIQYIAEKPCIRNCLRMKQERCICRDQSIDYEFGEGIFEVDHLPEIHQLGNVKFYDVLHFFGGIDDCLKRFRNQRNIADIIRNSRQSGQPIKPTESLNHDDASKKITTKSCFLNKLYLKYQISISTRRK